MSETCVWPQQITRASVRVTRSTVTDGSRSVGRPCVWLPGDAWQTRISSSLAVSAPLGGQGPHELQVLIAQLLAGPFGGRAL